MARPKSRVGCKQGSKRGHYPKRTDPKQLTMWSALEGTAHKQNHQDTRKRGSDGLTTNTGALKMGGGSRFNVVSYQGRRQTNRSATWKGDAAPVAKPIRTETRTYPRFKSPCLACDGR